MCLAVGAAEKECILLRPWEYGVAIASNPGAKTGC